MAIDILLSVVFLIVGFMTGVLAGLFGIGGGMVFVPALFSLLPVIEPNSALAAYSSVATSLFAGSFASLSSSYNHIKSGNVVKEYAILLAIGCVIPALTIPFLTVDINENYLKVGVGIIILFSAIKMLIDINSKKEALCKPSSKSVLTVGGIIAGTIGAFAGVGGGVIYVPLLKIAFCLDIKKAVGTSSVVVLVTMLLSAVMYSAMNNQIPAEGMYLGYVNLAAGVPLGIGAVIGARKGVGFLMKYKSDKVLKLFTALLIVLILKMMFF